ncbi:MAG: pyridoxal-phosphate dependent enzyme [Phycisphaerae bacterium]|nr:pyridoxal-phosphate dependent enzyme [Phycisphaerae bacterium]
MKRCETVLEAIGGTPLVRLNRVGAGLAASFFAKLEFVNPGGSVKDRVATAMIEQAEREGELKPGSTIIEATSGNTGAGLAMAAAVKGYRCIFVAPDRMSIEKVRLLRAYGAELVLTPTSAPSKGSEGYEGVAQRLLNEIPDSWHPNQFGNLVNPQSHYETTGREIWEQTEGKVTVFVAGVGTGGTISGVGQYLKEKNPRIKVIGVDSEASVLSGAQMRPSAVEGIGEDHVPQTLNAHVVDEWIRVGDKESFLAARRLARLEGLLVGGSSGAVTVAMLQYGCRLGPEDLVVTIFADGGRNYLSRIYADEWMIEHGHLEGAPKMHTVAEVLELRGSSPLICVAPDDTAETAIQRLREHDISQMPVIDDGRSVGSIREMTVARLLHDQRNPNDVQVGSVMARPLPQVEFNTEVSEVYRLLMTGHSGVLVTRAGAIEGIVTRIDLINFWETTRTDSTAANGKLKMEN